MKPALKFASILGLAAGLFPLTALAHPHVWITGKSVVIMDAAGNVTGVRHAWTFDEMFTALAIQGHDTNQDGDFSREELTALAQVNVESLGEYDFFTFMGRAGNNDNEATFQPAVDYWLDYDREEGRLTLNFTLPLAEPVSAIDETIEVEVYDPSYFVAFAFAEGDEAAAMVNAPDGCQMALDRGADPDVIQQTFLSKFSQLDTLPDPTFGAQFAEVVRVTCSAN